MEASRKDGWNRASVHYISACSTFCLALSFAHPGLVARQRFNSDARLHDVAAALRRHACRRVDHRRELRVARKPATRAEFTLFDVFYEDGSRRSNRRVPSKILGGLDGDAPARAVIEEQDRIIAEKSGFPASPIKGMRRSGGTMSRR